MGSWTVHEDGSFDVAVEGLRLVGCYPAIDGAALHPQAIVVDRSKGAPTVEYRLPAGSLVLAFAKDEDSLVLKATLRGMAKAPHWVLPLSGGRVEGAAQFFKQGLGFGGPSGFFPLDAKKDPWTLESYFSAGLVDASDATLAIGAYDHARFLFKAVALNRVHRRGLVDRHIDRAEIQLECGFSTERVALGGELALPDIHFIASSRPWDAFRRLAIKTGRVMKARTSAPPSFHWCSWYRRACHFSRQDLDEMLRGLATIKPAMPLQTIQIDDGYCASPGDWLDPTPQWPGGLESAFKAIRAQAYKPGVWIAPFMIGSRSNLYRQHPDWVIRGVDGKPVIEWNNYGGSAIASHNDEETYAIDTSHPEAFAYLRSVFKSLRTWGCRFIKTDFMDWGFKDSLTVKRHAPGKTSVEYFREALAMIREEMGEDTYWLGCIAPFGPFIGMADGMRVANDVVVEWSKGSTGNMIDECWADQYFNNVWWQNDPDVVFLRDQYIKLSDGEIKALAYFHGILGTSINSSDAFHEIPPARLKLWRFIEPNDKRWTATLPFWNKPRKLKVAVRDFEGADSWAVLALNQGEDTVTEQFRMKDAIGLDEAFVYQWEPGRAKPIGKQSALVSEVGAHGGALYFVSKRDEPPPPDLSLGGKNLTHWVTGAISR